MEIDNPQMAGSAAASAAARPNPFADEVERIVQSAEGRELSSAAIGGDGGDGADGGGGNSPVGSPPARITGAGAPGGPLAASEIGRLSVLCASLEQQQPSRQSATTVSKAVSRSARSAAAAATNANKHQTDAEAAHDVPGAPASDDDELDDACPALVGWAGVDGDVLAQLIPMLEKHVRSAASVDLIGEARAVCEHGGAGAVSGGARKRGGSNSKKKMGGTSSSGEDDDDEDDNDDDGVGVLGRVANATGAGRKAATVSEVSWALVVVVLCGVVYDVGVDVDVGVGVDAVARVILSILPVPSVRYL